LPLVFFHVLLTVTCIILQAIFNLSHRMVKNNNFKV
jgi:hypothetical protein